MGSFKRDNKFGGKRGGGGFSGRSDRSERSGRFDRPERGERAEMHRAVCSDCGKNCEVPFRPTGDKPVFCSDCFSSKREGSSSRDFGGRDSGRSSFGGRDSGRSNFEEKRMYEAVCGKCGEDCEVPFKPTSNKPVYCSNCFSKGEKSPKSIAPDNVQFEAIHNKLDKILKMLGSNNFTEVKEKKAEVKEVKAVEVKAEEVKPKKVAKSKEKKEVKEVVEKKEKAKKKK
jgi:CxxC-x17-CxxC domain-containing protein